jgi:hypothetical protein
VSIPVELSALGDRIDECGERGYLLTAGSDGRPHTVGIDVSFEEGLLVMRPGNSTVANAEARPLVALLWAPAEPGGYSLIVDAEVVSAVLGGDGGNSLTLRPTKAVLHRPVAWSPEHATQQGCTADCVPVYTAGSGTH